MSKQKTVFIVLGLASEINEIVELYETDSLEKANKYKEKYESRKSIYEDFTVIKENIPAEYESFKEYKSKKI